MSPKNFNAVTSNAVRKVQKKTTTNSKTREQNLTTRPMNKYLVTRHGSQSNVLSSKKWQPKN